MSMPVSFAASALSRILNAAALHDWCLRETMVGLGHFRVDIATGPRLAPGVKSAIRAAIDTYRPVSVRVDLAFGFRKPGAA